MRTYILKNVDDQALDHLINERGVPSNIGLYYGVRKGGRKILELVKAGAHVDADKAKAVYTHTRQLRSGEVVVHKYYELKDVIVYNRLNHAKYHRLLLAFSRRKLNDAAQLGGDLKSATLNDADIAKILGFSRGEMLCKYGKHEYQQLG